MSQFSWAPFALSSPCYALPLWWIGALRGRVGVGVRLWAVSPSHLAGEGRGGGASLGGISLPPCGGGSGWGGQFLKVHSASPSDIKRACQLRAAMTDAER